MIISAEFLAARLSSDAGVNLNTSFLLFTPTVNQIMTFRLLDHVLAQKPTRMSSFETENRDVKQFATGWFKKQDTD